MRGLRLPEPVGSITSYLATLMADAPPDSPGESDNSVSKKRAYLQTQIVPLTRKKLFAANNIRREAHRGQRNAISVARRL